MPDPPEPNSKATSLGLDQFWGQVIAGAGDRIEIAVGQLDPPAIAMRREMVVAAMLYVELPFEQRGRIRYARVSDVKAWEEGRLQMPPYAREVYIHPDLLEFI